MKDFEFKGCWRSIHVRLPTMTIAADSADEAKEIYENLVDEDMGSLIDCASYTDDEYIEAKAKL